MTHYTPYVTRKQRGAEKEKRKKLYLKLCIGSLFLILLIGMLVVAHRRLFPRYLRNQASYGSSSLANSAPDTIPNYEGRDFIFLNDGMPLFNNWDVEKIKGEHFSNLDSLGRCGVAYAMLDRSMMPSEEREEIGQVKPSGWVQAKYEGIVDSKPPYLYNRCHLIAYALTGQNANELNLITGTRYLNVSIMLPWEEKVIKYLEDTDNHVLYRVTPLFRGDELVARGLEIEAYSVEDAGEGICFHVFIYNIQPGVEIDYMTGNSLAMIKDER